MTRFRLTTSAVLSLIALRIAIGWHFYQEGATKIQGAPFSSGAVFLGAKGPLAEFYRMPVWDPYGMERLDRRKTEAAWMSYVQSIAADFHLDDKAKKRLEQLERAHRRQLREVFEEIGPELIEYRKNVGRLEKYRRSRAHREVASLRQQMATIEQKIRRDGAPWLTQIDDQWDAFEADIRRATLELTGKTPPSLTRPGRRWYDTKTIDRIVPYFDAVVGACLVVGCFTRTAAWVAALFLAMIVGSQFPGTPDAAPTYYQVIECLALVTLATTGAGRFGSVDALWWRIVGRRHSSTGESNDE